MIISLKRKIKNSKPEIAQSPKESYPSFSIYEEAPAEVMGLAIGQDLTAKIRLASKEKHEGKDTRRSCGFDVINVDIPIKKRRQRILMR